MNRRSLLLLPLAILVTTPAVAQTHAAVLSDADQTILNQISQYLNNLRAIKARFLQVGPDDATTQGTLWLQRPGRMRFQYDKPSPLLLVAGSGTVVFHDSQLDQTTNIPVKQTPLGLLLADTITLSGAGEVTVTDFQTPPGQVLVTLVRTKTPGDGSLTLAFNANPLALVGWAVVDAQGRETRLRLSQVVPGGPYDPSLFVFNDPDAGK
jgi:outer membrane lipoprotein-sorting protein